jgi:hypothetical protein
MEKRLVFVGLLCRENAQWRRCLALLCLVLPLSGCFQVELVGPVADAEVTIAPLREPTNVIARATTLSPAAWIAFSGEEGWQGIGALQSKVIGIPALKVDDIDPETLYLVTATGGLDYDADSDGTVDRVPTAVGGSLHVIATGAQIAAENIQISPLTEALYQALLPELDTLSDLFIEGTLNTLSEQLVEDVEDNGYVSYEDVLLWKRLEHSDFLKARLSTLDTLAAALADGEPQEHIAALAVAAVTSSRAGLNSHTSASGSWDFTTGQDYLSVDNVVYQIEVENRVPGSITLTSAAADTYLYLLDRNGKLLFENDDYDGTTNSQLVGSLDPGTYFVVAATYLYGSTGDFELLLDGATFNESVMPYTAIATEDAAMPAIFRSVISDTYLGLLQDENRGFVNGAVFVRDGIDRVEMSFNPQTGLLYELTVGEEQYLFSNYTSTTVDITRIVLGEEVELYADIPLSSESLVSVTEIKTAYRRVWAGSTSVAAAGTVSNEDNQAAEWSRKGLNIAIDAFEKAAEKGSYKLSDVALDTIKKYSNSYRNQVAGDAISPETAKKVADTVSLLEALGTKFSCYAFNIFSCARYLVNKGDNDRVIDDFANSIKDVIKEANLRQSEGKELSVAARVGCEDYYQFNQPKIDWCLAKLADAANGKSEPVIDTDRDGNGLDDSEEESAGCYECEKLGEVIADIDEQGTTGEEYCGDGVDNNLNDLIDEDCGYSISITVDDNQCPDDVIGLRLDGIYLGNTPIGKARTYDASFVTPGKHELAIIGVKSYGSAYGCASTPIVSYGVSASTGFSVSNEVPEGRLHLYTVDF